MSYRTINWAGRICFAALLAYSGGCVDSRVTGILSDHSVRRDLDGVLGVAWPLFRASAEFCPFDVEPTYGFELDTQAGTPTSRRSFPHVPIIRMVSPGLPAFSAGIPVEAALLRVNEEPVDQLEVEEVRERIRRAATAKIEPLSLSIWYADRLHEFNLYSVAACRYHVRIAEVESVNAFSDGRSIIITRGMLDFVVTKHELAFVLAHEIAHNALQHAEVFRLNQAVDNFLHAVQPNFERRAIPGARRAFETEADQLALHIMARAGNELRGSLSLMARLKAGEPHVTAESYGEAHPPTSTRLRAIEGAIRAMQSQRIEGGPSARP
jgi:beta-barrel assembly-enhancing protease